MDTPKAPLAYTIDEVAKLMGIGRTAAYEAAKRGDLPSIKIGRRLFIPRVALDRMLEGCAPRVA